MERVLGGDDEHRIGRLRHVDLVRDRDDRHQATLQQDHRGGRRSFRCGWVSTISMRETSESGSTLGAPEPAREHDEAATFERALVAGLLALLVGRLLDAEVGGDAGGIEDEHDRAVAEDGVAAEDLEVRERGAQAA